MASVKFLAFADLHHYPQAFYTYAPERLAAIRGRAIAEKVDFVISLGDFSCGKSQDLLIEYAAFPMKTYHVFGNHDTDDIPLSEALKNFNMPGKGYYFFDCNDFRFIVLDNNYVEIDGRIVHFELGNYYPHPNTREILPAEQVVFLRETIASSPYPCVLFSHSSIERECDQAPGRPFRSAIINRQEIIEPDMAAGGVAFYDGVKVTPPITEQQRWYDAIENDTDPVVLPEQACVVSEILEAIYTSAKTGEPVYFNK